MLERPYFRRAHEEAVAIAKESDLTPPPGRPSDTAQRIAACFPAHLAATMMRSR
jgi:hypothetical protein